jgi:hypothetical protein
MLDRLQIPQSVRLLLNPVLYLKRRLFDLDGTLIRMILESSGQSWAITAGNFGAVGITNFCRPECYYNNYLPTFSVAGPKNL